MHPSTGDEAVASSPADSGRDSDWPRGDVGSDDEGIVAWSRRCRRDATG